MEKRKAKLDIILSKALSTKLQVVILATLLFIFVDRFTDTSLVFVYAAYIGGNVFQKWIQK